jgi:hypothetical protein
VFGQDAVWVEQKGRPYFGSAIQEVMNRELAAEINAALEDALMSIGARGR